MRLRLGASLVRDRGTIRVRAMKVAILSGERGCGKTTVCAKIVKLAQAMNLSVRGILTLPRYSVGKKIGLDVQDIVTGNLYPLAEIEKAADGPVTGHFHFHAEGLRCGSEALGGVAFCDMLLIDELGPLELVAGQGWRNAIDVLNADVCRLAVVVVRPALINHLLGKLEGRSSLVLNVSVANRDKLPEQILNLL